MKDPTHEEQRQHRAGPTVFNGVILETLMGTVNESKADPELGASRIRASNLRDFLCHSKEVPKGYTNVRVKFKAKANTKQREQRRHS